ncbi:MAG: DUF4296 domain-containing protein [Bacteroidota bacterium]
MKKYIIIVISFLVFYGCEDKQRPENLISEEQMSDILYDMFIVNSAKGVNRRLLEINGVKPETYILEKHNIDSLQFATSNEYYAKNFEQYRSIINKVKSKIEAQKVIYDKALKDEMDERKRVNDSAFKARKAKAKQAITNDSINKQLTAPIKN